MIRNRYLKLAFIFIFLFAGLSLAAETVKKAPTQLFYSGNNFYEKRDYLKALEEYVKIIDMKLESGNLYYNVGNSFFKLGKLGYAILSYEKARKFMPQDSDLKSNLAYARSLTAAAAFTASRNPICKVINAPFAEFNINAIAISGAVFYLILALILTLFILNPFAARKFRFALIVFVILFLLNLSAFAVRYYETEILKYGIVLQKNTECRYEPIDVSTTYYKLQAGDEVLILKTRNGWRQITRIDGKIGWVKKNSVGEI